MKKLLNVLYVTTENAYLSLDGENIVVLVDYEEKFRVPSNNIESIVCLSYSGASPAIMGFCAEKAISLCFLQPNGKFLARVQGAVRGNVLLRKRQYFASESKEECVQVSKNIITAKLINSKVVIDRMIRDHPMQIVVDDFKHVSNYLKESAQDLQKVNELEQIRGIEGSAARVYFSIFSNLILHQKEHFFIIDRNKRPPKDNLNALLSFLYTLLAHDIQSALETVGIDPYVGFLHKDRPGRASLALDLMEELRAFLADRLAVSLINRKQISPKGFSYKETGGVIMDNDTKKVVITAWQERKKEELTHPFLNEKIKVGLIPYAQSLLLARYLRGDLEEYPPFLWR